MAGLTDNESGTRMLVMGNEAIVRGVLEADVRVVAGYPGTPSSEIVERLSAVADERGLHVEWSTNEKVASEVAAAGSFAGLRSMCTMKQNGVNVASDFLIHLAVSGTRSGMVVLVCDDPGALSSVNEAETAYLAKQLEIPLLEPGNFQEAKDLIPYAFDLSEELRLPVMVRSVTRLSHASGQITTGKLPPAARPPARFKCNNPVFLDADSGAVFAAALELSHPPLQQKMKRAEALFDDSPFNTYEGPANPELLVMTRSGCYLYCQEAIHVLGLTDRAGLLKLGTTWPLPENFVKEHLASTGTVLIVEEVLPFMEENVKVLAAESAFELGPKKIHGKRDGTIPPCGELSPDPVITALCSLCNISFEPVSPEYKQKALMTAFTLSPNRDMTFCAGCPHRASFWNIHNALVLDGREGFVCGDIGCYSLGIQDCGFKTIKTIHAMGSGAGIASGFGKLDDFGMDQPVLAVCGDSTFFHAVLPALVNACHNRSNMTLVVLDNGGTAMTGFQPHPGLDVDALGNVSPRVDIAGVSRAIGAHVEVSDPFDLETTRQKLNDLMELPGTKVLVLKQMCALSPEKKNTKKYTMSVDETLCKGDECGCNRLCTRIWACPGLTWDKEKKKVRIDTVLCTGCGVCADICPQNAIRKEE